MFFATSISKAHYHHCLLSPLLSLVSLFSLCCHCPSSFYLFCCFFGIIHFGILMFVLLFCLDHFSCLLNVWLPLPQHFQGHTLSCWSSMPPYRNVPQKVFKIWKVALLQVKNSFIINIFQSNISFYINQNRLVTFFLYILVEFKLIQLFLHMFFHN
jgi:hypothetical protein